MAVKNTCLSRPWYHAYRVAMLETDTSKIFISVESARKAIQDRVYELSHSLCASDHESKELDRAMRFLNMLLNCSIQDSMLMTRDSFGSSQRSMASAVQ